MKYYFYCEILYVVAFASFAFGFKANSCFECGYNGRELTAEENRDCRVADRKFLIPCDDYCIKISGFVDGEPAGIRQCADHSWVDRVGGDDNCVNTSSIPNFYYAIKGNTVTLVDGQVCVCSENECNGQEKRISGILSYFTPFFLAVLGSVYN